MDASLTSQALRATHQAVEAKLPKMIPLRPTIRHRASWHTEAWKNARGCLVGLYKSSKGPPPHPAPRIPSRPASCTAHCFPS